MHSQLYIDLFRLYGMRLSEYGADDYPEPCAALLLDKFYLSFALYLPPDRTTIFNALTIDLEQYIIVPEAYLCMSNRSDMKNILYKYSVPLIDYSLWLSGYVFIMSSDSFKEHFDHLTK